MPICKICGLPVTCGPVVHEECFAEMAAENARLRAVLDKVKAESERCLKGDIVDELDQCPFCGGTAKLRVQEVVYGLCGAWVYCMSCGAQTGYKNTHELLVHQGRISTPMTEESRARGIELAIEAWNRRDVAPVRHGRWEQTERWATKAKYRCSVCGREIMSGTMVNKDKYPYCHCGAKMDGDDNG